MKEAKKRQKLEEKRAREAAEKNAAKKKFSAHLVQRSKREAAVSANNTSGGNGETVRKLVEEEYVDEKVTL